MTESMMTIAYLLAGILFILSLSGLSKQETARMGNIFGAIGMVIAIGATLADPRIGNIGVIIVALVIGGALGAQAARQVAMTAMPELVAILHSFVGLAAVLVGASTYLASDGGLTGIEHTIHLLEIWFGVFIGAVTFTGSIIAWGKLNGTLSGRPLLLPGRHVLNLLAMAAIIGCAVPFLHSAHDVGGHLLLLGMTGLSFAVGAHLVLSIGGADMPVVVSMLNSYSGWAAAAAGFMLSNDLLIITGALVGSSGAILSYIMCKAMNRSFISVILGGFGTDGGKPAAAGDQEEQGEVQPLDVDGVAGLLDGAQRVIVVPGYGMAVARAQNAVKELAEVLGKREVEVRYAIHPVAGRLPGHMNVLLAEAGVPYDTVMEMDEINEDFPKTDVVFVIGANDIVNPGALSDPSSPIFGMPVLEAWDAKHVVVLKRGMGSGYAGVQNPLFFNENTNMLFGDAKDSVEGLVSTLRR